MKSLPVFVMSAVLVLFPPLLHPHQEETQDTSIIGNSSTTGVFRPANGALYLKAANASGFADALLTYGLPGDSPVTGDWDGDGVDTIGVYRDGTFYLRNSNTNGFSDIVFAFGAPGDQPVAGDWNGDGVTTVGVYRNGTFFLRNTNTSGPPDIVFDLGIAGDIAIVGDWDGSGTDRTGVFRPSSGVFYLKDSNTTGLADLTLTYGLPGDLPVAGDWDGDGSDTIGVYRDGTFHLRNSNSNGVADLVFALGIPGDLPIVGRWKLLVPDAAIVDQISPVGDRDLYAFTLDAGDRVVLQATRTSGFVTPCVEVAPGIDEPAVAGGTACLFPAARVDLTLPEGTYFVRVYDQSDDATGDYTLVYERLSPQSAAPLEADVQAVAQIDPVGDLDLYTFTLDSGDRVVLQARRHSGLISPCLELLSGINGPALSVGISCGFSPRLDLTLGAGTYFVLVYDQVNDATGGYTLLYQRLSPQSAVPLAPDVPALEQIDPVGDLDLYTFTLEMSDRVVLVATAASGSIGLCLDVLSGINGPVVSGTECKARQELTLAAGTYFLLVYDQANNAAGNYTLLYQPLRSQNPVPLAPGTPAIGTISPAGDADLFTFTLDTSDKVVLVVSGGFYLPCLEVLSGIDGPTVSGGTACANPAARVNLTLPAGTYFVLVYGFSSGTGGYTLLYQRLNPGTAVPLTPDVETVQQIIFRGDLDIYTFTLDDLNRVLLQATGIYPVGACLEVISGINGPQIWTQSCVPARADVNLQPGTYYVLVTDGNNDATGNYKLLYQRLRPQDAVPLAADVPVVEQIDPVGDLDLYSFTLETSSRVVLQATSNTVSLTPCIQVKSSIGGPAGVTCGSPSAGVDVTLAAGKYFVLVYHQRWDRMGEYTLLYQRPGP